MGSSDRKEKKKHKKEKKSKKSKHSDTPERQEKKRKVRDEERSESDTPDERRKGSEEPKKGGVEEAPAAKNNNEISLSVEETNKLREKLGLKPLDVKKTSTNEVHAPPKNMGRALETEQLVEKMKVMKEKRKIKQELARVRSLGSTTSTHEFTDTLAWVNRNRNIEAKKKQAESQTKMLDAMDDEFGIGDIVENSSLFNKKKEYTSKDLENLTVQHDIEHFKEGDMTVLTLQDKGILDEDQDDVLENVNMVDNDKLSKNLELLKKKPDYNPYDEEFDENGKLKSQNMLSKYNEVIEGEKKKQFTINNSTSSADTIKRKLAAGLAPTKNIVNLDSSHLKKVATEYYSNEEIASFKKPKTKKKRKIRKTTVDDIMPLPSEARMGGKDSGSRSSRGKRRGDVVRDDGDNMEIDIDSKPVKRKSAGVLDDEELFSVKVEDDDSDLQAALSRSRRLAVKKMQPTLQDRLNAIPMPKDSLPGATKAAQIVLDTTAEFAKGVGGLDGSGKPDEEVKEMEVEAVAEQNNNDAWNEVDFVTAQYGEFQDYTPQKTEAMAAEPLLQRGLCGALAMASRKGFIEESKKGRTGRDIGDSIAATGLLKAKFFQIDRDTGQDVDARRRDRDYGSSSFPEKKSYNPDVKIVYTDGAGRELNSKEAFRQLSHKFHGKGSGKMKTEKRQKKVLEQLALKKMDSDDTPLGSAGLLREKQKEANSTYIVLSGGNRMNPDANTNISKNPSKSSKR